MARQQDLEATARAICAQLRINIIEHVNGSLQFVGQGLDFKVRCWADVNLNDLKPRRLHC